MCRQRILLDRRGVGGQEDELAIIVAITIGSVATRVDVGSRAGGTIAIAIGMIAIAICQPA